MLATFGRAELLQVCQALSGPEWLSPVARELGISKITLRAYTLQGSRADGARSVPPNLRTRLQPLLHSKHACLDSLRTQLAPLVVKKRRGGKHACKSRGLGKHASGAGEPIGNHASAEPDIGKHALLVAVAQALYGLRWHRVLAADLRRLRLPVEDVANYGQSLGRMGRGAQPIPDAIWGRLARLVDGRLELLGDLVA